MVDQSYEELTALKGNMVSDILGCESKDASGLNDFQKLPTKELIAIPRVGINRFRLPVHVRNKEGEIRSHDAVASMYVNINEKKNGVSMSRLVSILQDTAGEYCLNNDFFQTLLDQYRKELMDETDTEVIDTAFLRLKFNFPIKQNSLKSENWGWQYYPVEFETKKSKAKGLEIFMQVQYEYSSTCPCSLSMAKQYEAEYLAGTTKEGVGIGVPHSQRSTLKAKVKIDPKSIYEIEDLVALIRSAIPTETQSLVKRVDEQAFAILNGVYPMFVEHATKCMHKALNSEPRILDWLVELEHLESLHSHNAAAVIYKGVEDGLRSDTIF